jgi:hypothetical protein
MQVPRISASRAAIWLLPVSALFTQGCFLGGETPQTPNAPAMESCVDVSAASAHSADSLVALANEAMVSNFQYWSEQDGEWQLIQRRNPHAAIGLYDQALRIAPGHCQAIFGRAVASATLLTQDAKMDAFMAKVEGSEPLPVAKAGAKSSARSMAALMKMTPDQAAPVLLKTSAKLREVDRPTVAEAQALIETVLMPKLDSTIAAMESVMDFPLFAIRFSVEGDTVEIDHSEIGPGLAGLKVMKAFLTIVAGYQWEVALDGNYDWVDSLSEIQMEDYDHLSSVQTRALDHLTGFFSQASPFSKVRPAWRTPIQGIPALLLDAVGDAQNGLRATIAEAAKPQGQEFDPWRAGGKDADVDTVDLRIAIEALERSKKYLAGEVPISYEKGARTLKVNFPRVFAIDGLQGMLPYYRILPYAQWNDTLSSDTTWYSDGLGYMTYSTRQKAIQAMGYGPRDYGDDWDVSVNYNVDFQDTGRVTLYNYADPSGFSNTLLATFWADSGNPCSFHYQKQYALVGKATDAAFEITPSVTTGSFQIGLCKDEGGVPVFADLKVNLRGPFEFTNASGTPTLTFSNLDSVDAPMELAGKIIFRDPTFGGIFPDLTNANVWEYVQSLENIDSRTERTCDYERDDFENQVWKCTRTLPQNPSDLDYFFFALYWGDDIL